MITSRRCWWRCGREILPPVFDDLICRNHIPSVVPAKAGTHTPCARNRARPSINLTASGYGSPPSRGRQERERGDDGGGLRRAQELSSPRAIEELYCCPC